MTYGIEIWISHEGNDVKNVQHSFCKYILRIPKQSSNIFALGELGRYSTTNNEIIYKKKTTKYWLRILNMNENRYPKFVINYSANG